MLPPLTTPTDTEIRPGWPSRLAVAFDRLYSDPHRKSLERWVVGLSIGGFLAHLGHIFLARHLTNPPPLITAAGRNYLAAISTPFSFILFYEVLTLISAIPASTTQSIAKQFEVVSLIFIRGFFSEIAALDFDDLRTPNQDLTPAFVDVGAGLLMFLLVTIFRHAASSRHSEQAIESPEALVRFIDRKKALALGLAILFVSLAANSVWDYASEVYRQVHQGALSLLAPPTAFYSGVFTVMIFTDVFILILSLVVSDRYELVFRNAAFVISTILIRFSLTAARGWAALLGVSGMIFGILTLLIYNYHCRVKAKL